MSFTPDFNAIPSTEPVQQLINGIGAFTLLLALLGIIIGGAMWAGPCGGRLAVLLPPSRRRQAGHTLSSRWSASSSCRQARLRPPLAAHVDRGLDNQPDQVEHLAPLVTEALLAHNQ
jgi:hypothetical protein